MQIKDHIKSNNQSKAQQHWRAIIRWFEEEVSSRRLVPGNKLPTELQFCEQFSMNRHNVRRALAHLQARGVVESTQGRGSFVRRPTVQYEIGRRTRFSAALQQQAAEPTTRTLVLETRPAEQHIAAALGIKPGALTFYLERLGFANKHPISISQHWFAFERFPSFDIIYKRSFSITQTLIDSGIPDYTRVRTKISSRLPTSAESKLLNLPRHIPLLIAQAWNVDSMGEPLEYGVARMASNRIEISIDTEPLPVID
ncbi:MAG: GntR family transcriptional regulator phosphonate transport system regulatory protein [Hyphomonadaceae bacterium]|nr:MAG: GntR family transcriptional regulator phosphonate transport system regulatory protein [Hyphomonadaceae bacterium]KAF0183638.1 MAG: GntR family transcriptional regulator phosphonate transport system regulatory protein [Hyphomonadaceae bacterium]